MKSKSETNHKQPDPNLARRMVVHERVLGLAHLAAFVGTGLAWLKFRADSYLPINRVTGNPGKGALLFTAGAVLLVSCPYLLSHFVSKSRLHGKVAALWAFLAILLTVSVTGVFALQAVSTNASPRLFSVAVTIAETLVLANAARLL